MPVMDSSRAHLRRVAVAAAAVALSLSTVPSANAGTNDLIGDEGPGCAAPATRHSGKLNVQPFLTQEVKAIYNWCSGPDNKITWWQRPTLNVVSDIPFGGAVENGEIENATNTAVERPVPPVATYTFTVVQHVVKPTGAQQRFEMTMNVNGTVGMTSLCMGETCDRNVD